jgi:hypothetical protein
MMAQRMAAVRAKPITMVNVHRSGGEAGTQGRRIRTGAGQSTTG